VDQNDLDKIQHLKAEQQTQIKHAAIEVPSHGNNFLDNDTEFTFFATLENIVNDDIIPAGYGLLPGEWDGGMYPVFETLQARKRNGKEMRISLEEPIWYRRAILWGQAINLLYHFQ
jgi:hypothetical protein